MTDNNPQPKVTVEISPQTTEMVESQMAGETQDVKDETAALIEALKRRAQVEAQSAGTDRKSTRPELQSPCNLVCRLLLEKKKKQKKTTARL